MSEKSQYVNVIYCNCGSFLDFETEMSSGKVNYKCVCGRNHFVDYGKRKEERKSYQATHKVKLVS